MWQDFAYTKRGNLAVLSPQLGGTQSYITEWKNNNLKVRISAGVVIILNTLLKKVWSRAGKLPPITSDKSLNFQAE